MTSQAEQRATDDADDADARGRLPLRIMVPSEARLRLGCADHVARHRLLLAESFAAVGFEHMFTPNWTFCVEWDHISLNHRSIDFAGFTDNIHRDFDKVLVGINWRFGGASAPVAARY